MLERLKPAEVKGKIAFRALNGSLLIGLLVFKGGLNENKAGERMRSCTEFIYEKFYRVNRSGVV